MIKIAWLTSNMNRFSEWAVGVRYKNFFSPQIEKNLQLDPGKKTLPPVG